MSNENRDAKGKFAERTQLTALQYKTIAEMVDNPNKTDVCQKVGICRATLYHWLDSELFMDEYRKACERVYKMALGKAISKLTKMMDTNDKRTALKAVENILKLNSYLNSNIRIDENTNETITIKLLNDDEESLDE